MSNLYVSDSGLLDKMLDVRYDNLIWKHTRIKYPFFESNSFTLSVSVLLISEWWYFTLKSAFWNWVRRSDTWSASFVFCFSRSVSCDTALETQTACSVKNDSAKHGIFRTHAKWKSLFFLNPLYAGIILNAVSNWSYDTEKKIAALSSNLSSSEHGSLIKLNIFAVCRGEKCVSVTKVEGEMF